MSDMQVTIHDIELAEPAALAKVLDRLTWHWRATEAHIYCRERKPAGCEYGEPAGWLEYLLVMTYDDGGKLRVGCIERAVGVQMEFHS